MGGKGTNVVIPFGGGGSFYTDWERPDPKLGINKWETFLTRELPAYMAKQHNSDNKRNGIAGLSMSGTSRSTSLLATPISTRPSRPTAATRR